EFESAHLVVSYNLACLLVICCVAACYRSKTNWVRGLIVVAATAAVSTLLLQAASLLSVWFGLTLVCLNLLLTPFVLAGWLGAPAVPPAQWEAHERRCLALLQTLNRSRRIRPELPRARDDDWPPLRNNVTLPAPRRSRRLSTPRKVVGTTVALVGL